MISAVVDQGTLRQGDICEVEFFPLWDLKETMQTQRGGSISHLQIPEFKQCARSALTPGRRLAVVCSYDCDIENPRARKGLLIAPLIAVNKAHKSYEGLAGCAKPVYIASGDRYAFQHVNNYPYAGVADLTHGADLGVVEFSAMTALAPARDAAEELLKSKVYELTEEDRWTFQQKLAVFVSRIESAA